MLQPPAYRAGFGTIIFRAIGVCALLLVLLWNPIVLAPRFWNASVIARSILLDATLLAAGVGLFCLRKWAALLCGVLSLWAAVGLGRTSDPAGVLLTVILLTPLLLFFIFWRTLVWGNKTRDLLMVLAAVMVSSMIEYVAFLIHRS